MIEAVRDWVNHNPDILLHYQDGEAKASRTWRYNSENLNLFTLEDGTPLIDTVREWYESKESTIEIMSSSEVENPREYTQEYIDNTEFFMCDPILKGWGMERLG